MEKSSGEKKKKGGGNKSKSKTRAVSKKPISGKDEASSAGDQESIAGF
jgi:hypothetical protein